VAGEASGFKIKSIGPFVERWVFCRNGETYPFCHRWMGQLWLNDDFEGFLRNWHQRLFFFKVI